MSAEEQKANKERRTLYLKKLVAYERKLLEKLKTNHKEKRNVKH